MKTKQVYEAKIGAPFKKDDAQKIGEFIDKCKDKTTKGILEAIKANPEHVIYNYIEWDNKKAALNYMLQCVRNIVNHLEITIIRIGDNKPKELNVVVSAFESITEDNERKYVAIQECFTVDDYKSQIMNQCKNEMNHWIKKYEAYEFLIKYVKNIRKATHDLLAV